MQPSCASTVNRNSGHTPGPAGTCVDREIRHPVRAHKSCQRPCCGSPVAVWSPLQQASPSRATEPPTSVYMPACISPGRTHVAQHLSAWPAALRLARSSASRPAALSRGTTWCAFCRHQLRPLAPAPCGTHSAPQGSSTLGGAKWPRRSSSTHGVHRLQAGSNNSCCAAQAGANAHARSQLPHAQWQRQPTRSLVKEDARLLLEAVAAKAPLARDWTTHMSNEHSSVDTGPPHRVNTLLKTQCDASHRPRTFAQSNLA